MHARPGSLPFADLVGDTMLLYFKVNVGLDLARLWQHLYDAVLPPGPASMPQLRHGLSAWKAAVMEGRLSQGTL